MKRDAVYVAHMQEAIRRIEENVADGYDAFMASHTLQDAVLRNLHTLAEATQRLSPELMQQYSEIPWKQIAAFCNVVVHDYLGIDLQNIWNIVQRDIPPLKATTDKMAAMLH